jgi:galactokinase
MDRLTLAACDCFETHFQRPPTVVVRAPGRVNLIGEHTDYNGLPVLPFAIGQAHRVAAAVAEKPFVEMVNADRQYGAKTVAVGDLATFSAAGEWDNYLRAALLGLMDAGLLDRDHLARGLRLAVSSDLPSGVGLSSSSALVVGFALAALHLHSIHYGRQPLADVLAEAEHYVGTRGGGMDQTTCLLGEAGHALRIDFFPLEVESVAFAGEVEVFLSDSGVRVEKSGAGLALFNRRPFECRLALAAFKRAHCRLGGSLGEISPDAMRYWGDLVKPPLSLSHNSVLRSIRATFPQARYSLADVHRMLGIGEAEWDRLTTGSAVALVEPSDGFKLRQRAEHVLGEARRVDRAVEALRQSDWTRLAELIAGSHASCRDLYEISCPEIERLVGAANEAGALASRLTGAGFGGCVLHLVRREDAGRFEQAMKRQLGESLRLLRVAPSAGAEVIEVARASGP